MTLNVSFISQCINLIYLYIFLLICKLFNIHILCTAANIFLTDEANCLKLGDFGSAVQIKAHTTMPGELQGFVGTQG